MSSAATPPEARRSIPVTLLGVAVLLAGILGSLFSLFALLMAIGKPYASSASDPSGIFLIFILPPVTLLAGIGLLLRQRLARWWTMLLAAGLIGLGVKGLIAPAHENPAHAPVPGPAADALKHSVTLQSSASIAAGAVVFLGLLTPRVRREFTRSAAAARNGNEEWRVGHRGRDGMYYEERHGGAWQRIDLDGEMLTGRAHHVIYFADAASWSGYPEWARHRRAEIVARIKSRFREPDYEYQESAACLPRPVAVPPAPAVAAPPTGRDGSILPMLLFLLALAAGAFWYAARAVESGSSWLPAKYASHTVTRAESPLTFWLAVATIAGFGVACVAFALWIVRAAWKER